MNIKRKIPGFLPLCLPTGILLLTIIILVTSCRKDSARIDDLLLSSVMVGSLQLQNSTETQDVPLNQDIRIIFSTAIDTSHAKTSIFLYDGSGNAVPGLSFEFADGNKTVKLKHTLNLLKNTHYKLSVTSSLKGSQGQSFIGAEYNFLTTSAIFTLNSISLDNSNFMNPITLNNVKRQGSSLLLEFSEAVDTFQINTKFTLSGNAVYTVSFSNNYKTVHLTCQVLLDGYKKYNFSVSPALQSVSGYPFNGFNNTFFTEVDSTLKFPLITDDELLTLIQKQTFRYFYNFGHPASGMARERNTSGDIVTSGGSGFGVMALIVGMERGFITRNEGITRLDKIIHFLETCNRFHGAWSHWINGNTGTVVPFSTKDNGGDLVETAYMAQGLLTMRQYLNPVDPTENNLISRINSLYEAIEWDWYTRGGQNVLYWHWSPNYGWDMNFQIRGYNETLITYIMAASSTTHTIPASAYQFGYAQNGGIVNGKTFYGYVLPVGYDYGGPLFFAHYSFLGLDPRNLSDAYANYWTQNMNHSLINWSYCEANPKKYPNYSAQCWGLTASDIPDGYSASEPTNDLGVIAPTAAVSSLPYSPVQSMNAIRFFYYILGDKLWGEYGFYDAFDIHKDWWANSYLAIDQGPQICMIENYRTGLLWNLFMSSPEVQSGLTKLGFTYK
jgi:hypothetical protein